MTAGWPLPRQNMGKRGRRIEGPVGPDSVHLAVASAESVSRSVARSAKASLDRLGRVLELIKSAGVDVRWCAAAHLQQSGHTDLAEHMGVVPVASKNTESKRAASVGCRWPRVDGRGTAGPGGPRGRCCGWNRLVVEELCGREPLEIFQLDGFVIGVSPEVAGEGQGGQHDIANNAFSQPFWCWLTARTSPRSGLAGSP